MKEKLVYTELFGGRDIMLPDYSHSILSTISSILKYYHVDTKYDSLPVLDEKLKKKYKNVVLLILDGMGKCILDLLNEENYFRKNLVDVVTSVYPSTTTAAMNTYYSGRPPIETGWIAWSQYIKEYGRYLDMLRKRDSYTHEVYENVKDDIFENVMSYETIFERIEKSRPDVKTFDLTITGVYRKGKRYMNADSIEELVEDIEILCSAKGEKFILAYQDKPDTLLHKYGTESKEGLSYIEKISLAIEKMMETIDEDTLVIVSADHGHRDIGCEYNINDYENLKKCFIQPPALEARCLTFWIKPRMLEIFRDSFNKEFKDKFVLLTKEEFLGFHMLGYGKEHKKIDDFIGDYVAVSVSDSIINIANDLYPGKEKKLSTHCGLTKEEMLVPVILLEK